jgi:hypothetical protein
VGLFVAANRDEFYARPSSPPRLWTEGPVPILAPRDDQAGGTWIGFNAAGVFAAITNRFGASTQPRARSRGHLVIDALAHGSAQEAVEKLLGANPSKYNGFHLAVVDGEEGFVLWHDGDALRHRSLAPGVHVLTERSFRGEEIERERSIEEKATDLDSFESVAPLLRVHRENLVDGTCLHADEAGYGTRSSMIVGLDDSWRLLDARYADGHPCSHRYDDISQQFFALGERYIPV